MPKSKICLPDVNVWIAFAWQGHVRHEIVKPWFANLEPGQAAFCRVTQMAFLRLLTNRTIMQDECISDFCHTGTTFDLGTDGLIEVRGAG